MMQTVQKEKLKWIKLVEVCSIRNKHMNPGKKERYNYIALENIQSNTGKLINFTQTEGGKIKSSKLIFEKGDVLYGRLRPYLNKVHVAKFDGICVTDILPLKVNFEVLSDYLAYYLQSNSVVSWIQHQTHGIKMPRIGTKLLMSLQVPLPPLEEQKKIVALIESSFARIDKAKAYLLEAKKSIDNILQSAISKAIPTTDPLPKGWKWTTIGDICEVKGGKRIPKGMKISDHKTLYPYIRVTDFKNMSVDLEKVRYVEKEVYEQIKKYIIRKDDIYISIAGTIGLVGNVPDILDNALLTENAAKLITKNKDDVYNFYLSIVLNSVFCQSQIQENKFFVGVPKLALFRIEKIKIPLPPLKGQKEIVDFLNSITKYTKSLKKMDHDSLNKLDIIKSSILSKAFSGELI